MDSVAVCATFAETKMNFWSVVTSEDSNIIIQYALVANQISSCKGINSISDGTSYVVLETPDTEDAEKPRGPMYLLTINVLTKSNSVRVQRDEAIVH